MKALNKFSKIGLVIAVLISSWPYGFILGFPLWLLFGALVYFTHQNDKDLQRWLCYTTMIPVLSWLLLGTIASI